MHPGGSQLYLAPAHSMEDLFGPHGNLFPLVLVLVVLVTYPALTVMCLDLVDWAWPPLFVPALVFGWCVHSLLLNLIKHLTGT